MGAVTSPSNLPGQCGWFQSGLRGGKADGNIWRRSAAATPASAGKSPAGQTG